MIGTPEKLIAYAAARGSVIAEDEAPILLVKATDYMDTFAWTGQKPAGQEDCWPRTGITYDGTPLIDAAGDEVTEIEDSEGDLVPLENDDVVYTPPVTPQTIINATYRVAMTIGDGTDIMAPSSGGKVKQETVSGAVSITYADGTESDPLVIPGFDNMVAPWLGYSGGNGINFNVYRV